MAGLLLFLLLTVSVVSADEREFSSILHFSHNVCFSFIFVFDIWVFDVFISKLKHSLLLILVYSF